MRESQTDFITVLRSVRLERHYGWVVDKTLAKQFFAKSGKGRKAIPYNDGVIYGSQYDRGFKFRFEQHPVSSIEDLAELVGGLRAQRHCAVIRGKLKDGIEQPCQRLKHDQNKPGRALVPATIEEADHRWVAYDFEDDGSCEDWADAARDVRDSYLPEMCRSAKTFWTATGSAGVKAGRRFRFWFYADRTVCSDSLKDYHEKKFPGVDTSVFSDAHLHYTADPVFHDGIAPPEIQRAGWIDGESCVTLPPELVNLETYQRRVEEKQQAFKKHQERRARGQAQKQEREPWMRDDDDPAWHHDNDASQSRVQDALDAITPEHEGSGTYTTVWFRVACALKGGGVPDYQRVFERWNNGVRPLPDWSGIRGTGLGALWSLAKEHGWEDEQPAPDPEPKPRREIITKDVEFVRQEIADALAGLSKGDRVALLHTAGSSKSTKAREYIRNNVTTALGVDSAIPQSELAEQIARALRDWVYLKDAHRGLVREAKDTAQDARESYSAAQEQERDVRDVRVPTDQRASAKGAWKESCQRVRGLERAGASDDELGSARDERAMARAEYRRLVKLVADQQSQKKLGVQSLRVVRELRTDALSAHRLAQKNKRELSALLRGQDTDLPILPIWAVEQTEIVQLNPGTNALLESLRTLVAVPSRALAQEWARELRVLGVPAVFLEGRHKDNCEEFKTYTLLNRIRPGSGSDFCRDECKERSKCNTPKQSNPRHGAVNVTTHAMMGVLEEICSSDEWTKIVDERPAHWFRVLSLDGDQVRLARDVIESEELAKIARALDEKRAAFERRELKKCYPLIMDEFADEWELEPFDLGDEGLLCLAGGVHTGEISDEKAGLADRLERAVKRDSTGGFTAETVGALHALGRDFSRGAVTGSGTLDIALDARVPAWGGTVVYLSATCTDDAARIVLGENCSIVRSTARHAYGTTLTLVEGPHATHESDAYSLSNVSLEGLDAVVRSALSSHESVLVFASKAYTASLKGRYRGLPVFVDYYGSPTATGSNVYERVGAVILLPFHVSVAHACSTGRAYGFTEPERAIELGRHLSWRAQIVQASARVRPTNQVRSIYAYLDADQKNVADWWSEEYPLASAQIEHTTTAMMRWNLDKVWARSPDVDAEIASLVEEWTREPVSAVKVESRDRGGLLARINESLGTMLVARASQAALYKEIDSLSCDARATLIESTLAAILTYVLTHEGGARDRYPTGFTVTAIPTSLGSLRVACAGPLTPERIELSLRVFSPEVDWYELEGNRHTLKHDTLLDIQAAIAQGATSLRQIADTLGVTRPSLTRRIELQAGHGRAPDWIADRVAVVESDNVVTLHNVVTPNVRPIALPTCDCAACKPFKGYRVVKADAYTVTCDTPKGGTYQLPRAAVASIHAIDSQLPKPEDLDAVCALIDSLPDHASQVWSGDTLWTRRGTRWCSLAPFRWGQ